MRRPIWIRFFIACWAFWLGAALSEPAALSACPAHSSHTAHSATHGAGGMQAHHAAQHDDDSSSQSNTHCSCLGECCCTPSVAPPAATVAEMPATAITHSAPAVARESAPAAPAPYSHPFANGPPGDFVA